MSARADSELAKASVKASAEGAADVATSWFSKDRTARLDFSNLPVPGAPNLTLNTEVRDTVRLAGQEYLGFFVGAASKRQENVVAYSNSSFGVGDFTRVKTRFGLSSYESSDEFRKSIARAKTPEEQRLARFANVGLASGAAVSTRVEQDVIRSGASKVTLFQEFSYVDKWFEDLRFSDKTLRKKTSEDVFSKSDRQTTSYGASIVDGSSGVMLSHHSISNISPKPEDYYREQRFDVAAWLGPSDLMNRIWGNKESGFTALVPIKAWVGYKGGTTEKYGDTSPGSLQTADAGLFWQFGNAYSSISVWRSSHTQYGAAGLPAIWTGYGADLSVGIKAAAWQVNGYASINYSKFNQGSTLANDAGFNFGASSTLVLDGAPDITVAVDVADYGGTDPFLQSAQSGRLMSFGVAGDFAKYAKPYFQKLGFYYYVRKEGFDGRWGTFVQQSSSLNHVIGALVRASW
jgi:hypothetical protein